MDITENTKIAQTSRGDLLYNIHDTRVGRALEVYGEWGESEFEIISKIVKPGDVLVDVGAYIGTHTLFFSKAVGPQGYVYAFEPQKVPFQLLCKNIALNSLTNVQPLQAALGSEKHFVDVPQIDFSKKGDFGSYSASYKVRPGEKAIKVPVLTLDESEIPRANLMKIDVDGDELAVLLGAKKFLARTHAVVFVESNKAETTPELISLLESLEYEMFWHLDFAYRRGNLRGYEKDIFDSAFDVNILAVPKKLNALLTNFTPVIGPRDTWQAALERSKNSSAM